MKNRRLLACCSILLFAVSAAWGQGTFRWSNLAGSVGGAGDLEGTGSAARLNSPTSTAVDAGGNVYVADQYNHTIRKITSTGVMTTLAGAAGIGGSADGTGTAARFFYPQGVAVDGSGNVYVADSDNFTVRKITPAGVVSTLAGMAKQQGSADGAGSAARFSDVSGVAVDGNGNVYVTDRSNYTVRKITSDGVVSTFAGSAGLAGGNDGTGSAARFFYPYGVAVDGSGTVYVADTLNHTIRKITGAGEVSTLAGSERTAGSADGTGGAALFNQPYGVAVDGAGNIYVADGVNDTIRKITNDGVVSTLAGTARSIGFADGIGSAARFNLPTGVAVDGSGDLYVADSSNHTIRTITSDGAVSTFVGIAGSFPGNTDDTGSAARFNNPAGVALDASGNIYVADRGNHTVRKLTAAGVVSTLAGTPGSSGSSDGAGNAARFNSPAGVAVDGSGNVYVADHDNHTIRKITGDGVVSTLAGSTSSSTPYGGSADGTGSAAHFAFPSGVAVDGSGNVYVADTSNDTIRKITSTGDVTTFAGKAQNGGSADGAGSLARFWAPEGVAVDGSGNVYVADTGNHIIRKITSAGVVSTLAGRVQSFYGSNYGGSTDGTGSAALFDSPRALAVDGSGILYVADGGSSTVRKVTSAGVVTTVGGLAYAGGHQDGVGAVARFTNPMGVAVAPNHRVYVASGGTNSIALGTPVPGVTLQQASTPLVSGASTVDWGNEEVGGKASARTFTVSNQGTATLGGLAVGLDPSSAGEYVLSKPLGAPSLAPGESTTFTLTFNPSALGLRTGALHLTGDPNEPPFDVALSGTGIDTTPPVLWPVTITSSNANPAWARVGDTLTVHLLANEALQTPSITIDDQAATVTGSGTSWTGTVNVTAALPQGAVSFSVTAQDLTGNASSIGTTAASLKIDTVPPVVTPPADVTVDAMQSPAVTVDYPPATASDGASAVSLAYSKAGGSVFPLGITTVNVTATDAAGNATLRSFKVTVRDTTAPRVSARFLPLFAFVGQPLPDYLPQATFDDVSPIVAKRQSPAAGSLVSYAGNLIVTISATDASGNIGSTWFEVKVRPAGLLSEIQDSARPGALLAGGGGPPADARLVSYGDPAIDDAGNVAYPYVWSSVRSGRGVALSSPIILLFTGRTLIQGALAVGDVGNPVIDAGHVAVLGTLRRTAAPTVGVIFDQPAGGALSTTLRTLNDAPGTGGATFKDFARIGVAGSSLAFVAHLALNTGLPKTTATSDSGVWAQDATHALKLLLREGQNVGGKTIKTLVTFQPGNGSPGQGRGWVLNVNGVTQVHALVSFTDSTQALLAADNEAT